MNIILATEVIAVGGAETFVLRLANALQERGNRVIVFIFYKDMFNQTLYKSIAPNVQVIWPHMRLPWLARKIDGLFFRLKINRNIQGKYIKGAMRKLMQVMKTDIVHSHLLKSDRLCLQATAPMHIPVVTTIHGDYLQFHAKTTAGQPIPLMDYKAKAAQNLNGVKKIACISDKQLQFFNAQFPTETKGKLNKIYNGYDTVKPADDPALRKQLGIGATDFVFGMMSRGIAEKGWETAIEAFIKLNKENSHIVLVGESEYLSSLKQKYEAHKNIHFTGHSDEPLQWVNIFDAGMLPSVYASESLPTAVIEYLCCGKPVIASDAGEIVNMINTDGRAAGIIVPIVNNKVDINDLSAAMQRYLNNRDLYMHHKTNTGVCYAQFDMNHCVDKYLDMYVKAIAGIKD